jgi:hypothetical protein
MFDTRASLYFNLTFVLFFFLDCTLDQQEQRQQSTHWIVCFVLSFLSLVSILFSYCRPIDAIRDANIVGKHCTRHRPIKRHQLLIIDMHTSIQSMYGQCADRNRVKLIGVGKIISCVCIIHQGKKRRNKIEEQGPTVSHWHMTRHIVAFVRIVSLFQMIKSYVYLLREHHSFLSFLYHRTIMEQHVNRQQYYIRRYSWSTTDKRMIIIIIITIIIILCPAGLICS